MTRRAAHRPRESEPRPAGSWTWMPTLPFVPDTLVREDALFLRWTTRRSQLFFSLRRVFKRPPIVAEDVRDVELLFGVPEGSAQRCDPMRFDFLAPLSEVVEWLDAGRALRPPAPPVLPEAAPPPPPPRTLCLRWIREGDGIWLRVECPRCAASDVVPVRPTDPRAGPMDLATRARRAEATLLQRIIDRVNWEMCPHRTMEPLSIDRRALAFLGLPHPIAAPENHGPWYPQPQRYHGYSRHKR